jgi:hypothetical protein
MANDLGTRARWRIKCSQGNKRLRRVKDAKVNHGAGLEAPNALGEDAPIGFVDKPGPRTITFSVYEEVGDPEIDWDLLFATKEKFVMEQEIVGGLEWQFLPCRVAKVDKDEDADGKNMKSVEVLALDMKPL